MPKIALFVIALFCMTASVSAQDALPSLDQLDAGWNQLSPDGLVCSRGTPYSFFVRPGSSDNLVIYFQGGGACWDEATCSPGGPFDDSVSAGELAGYQGIFNFEHPDNPVAEDNVVVVAYCNGDLFSGSRTQTYGDVTINFNGFTNAQAALAWTYEQFPQPARVLVTGSSAGGIGAAFNAPYVLMHYTQAGVPESNLVVLDDAGVGVLGPGWDELDDWGARENLPDLEPYAPENLTSRFPTGGLYAASAAFPDVTFAHYSAYEDTVLSFFYTLQGGSRRDWTDEMLAIVDQLQAERPNYHAYVAWGTNHTILATPLFYTMQVEGVRFRDWFAALIAGQPVENVRCEDCETEELFEE